MVRKNRRHLLCLMAAALSVLSLSGCAPGGKPQEEKPQEAAQEEAGTGQAGTLDFVDVYGETYRMDINPSVPKKEYRDDGFSRTDGRAAYEDETYLSRPGVDVSQYQGQIDWEKVKADGFEFAMIRIGYRGYGEEGTLNPDPCFQDNMKNARNAGLDVGVYFFSQAVDREEALEEADFVLELLQGSELQMPVVYDPEHILHDEARTDHVSGEQFTENTKVFCERIREAGYEPMIYSNMLWEAFELDLEELEGYPVWYADYEPLPQTPYHFAMWQYTNEGTVDGIEGPVDLNIEMSKRK